MTNKPNDKTYVVTGATSGIGLALVEQLLGMGFHVIGVGRSPQRCQSQSDRLQAAYPRGQLAYCVADLSVQAEIRGVVADIAQVLSGWGVDALDGLVNNAGTFTFWQTLTPEGFETQWAVNHLAAFLLTHELLPRLRRSPDARVITVSSNSHYRTKLNWADIQLLSCYNPMKAYKQTKLANVLFTAELNRRLGPASSVRAVAADPGLVDTGIGEKSGSWLARWIWSLRRRRGISAGESAAGVAKLLLCDSLHEHPAIYWKHGVPKRPNPYALDEDHGRRLWEISAQMTGIN
jgi:NAD(P)-dependent dehydrogenase (short-subunit alcohol dehydrogenase family)